MQKGIPTGGIRLAGKNKKILEDFFLNPVSYVPYETCDYSDDFSEMVNRLSPIFRTFMAGHELFGILLNTINEFESLYIPSEKSEDDPGEWKSFAISLVNKIIEDLATYPRDYEFKLYLPNFRKLGTAEYNLSGGVKLVLTAESDFPAYLSIKARGFWEGALSPIVAPVFTKAKIFAFLLQTSQLSWPRSHLKHATAEVLDCTSNKLYNLSLPDGMPLLLGGLTLNLHALLNLANGKVRSGADLLPSLESLLPSFKSVLDALSHPDHQRIATAIEWYEDALTINNQTVALLEVCIGLEALLGDEEDMSEMTKRLCDRFAYTLGKTPADRKLLFQKYRQLLAVRGKVVHSKMARLDDEGYESLIAGRLMLEQMIAHELKQLPHD